ncbi:MAG: hypothetical protein J5830_03535 [Clostridia bacterium]|nr:hypothetical protein [Clostridia bacterium]
MKATPVLYKNLPAVELKNGRYAVTVLPGEGAKIVSFRTLPDGREYLWQNPSPVYSHTGLFDEFVDGECSAFDDMFPTIDPIVCDRGGRAGRVYRDHGEICRMPFSCSISENGVTLTAESAYLDYEYVKTVGQTENGDVRIGYRIENRSDSDFHVLWAGHCMLRAEDGGEVITPFPEGSPVDIMFDNTGEIGRAGERKAVTGEMLRSRLGTASPDSYKYYFPSTAPRGYLGYRYPDGRVFAFNYDPEKIPFVGIWMNDGFFHGHACVGLEPCNPGYDTIINAREMGQENVIPARGALEFEITISVGKE